MLRHRNRELHVQVDDSFDKETDLTGIHQALVEYLTALFQHPLVDVIVAELRLFLHLDYPQGNL